MVGTPPAWTWVLADAHGRNLCELHTASGKRITWTRNAPAEARFTISHADQAAARLLGALANTGVPRLKCYRRLPAVMAGTLVFYGFLASLDENLSETTTLDATFHSPIGHLLGGGTNRGRFTEGSVTFDRRDAGLIALDLIDAANAGTPTGLSTASEWARVMESKFAYTKIRDRYYEYANIGEEIMNLASMDDGFDFDEFFVDGDPDVMAEINIYGRQGEDKPSVRFEYGPDTMANVSSVTRATEPPVNVVRILGGNGLVSTRQDDLSVTRYGQWFWQEAFGDIIEQSTLDARAIALLRPKPIRTLTFTPELGLVNCPRPIDDVWLGDSVELFARRDAFTEDASLRVNEISMVIDDNGFEATEIPDPITPEEYRVMRAHMTVEVE